ncbi:hypothetical protein Celaphus_00011323, partial [Cervus elaphus hippelaphus]
ARGGVLAGTAVQGRSRARRAGTLALRERHGVPASERCLERGAARLAFPARCRRPAADRVPQLIPLHCGAAEVPGEAGRLLRRVGMEVNCLTLKDLISRPPRLDFAIEDGENSQKENIFVDLSRMAPKTPIKNEPIDLSKQKIFTPERNPITPVKLADRQQAEPWTPTANLKMLISAASPDIRDREKKKGLFRPIENKDDAFPDSLQLDVVDDSAVDEFEKQRPSRKQKSLGLLCQKFLARYPSYPLSTEKTTISLDEVAVSLGEEQKYEEQMAHLQQKELDLIDYKFGERRRDGCPDSQDPQLLDFSEADYPSSSANSRKDKSLRIMSQKFVTLFLVSKTKRVTLDVAAKILIEESQDTPDHSKFKTKVRRLYDIANVLTSLALIKKVHVTEDRGRKPAFKWIGPVDFSSTDDDLVDVSTPVLPELKKEIYGHIQFYAKQKLARHGSFNSEQASERIQRKVNSEPSSPYRQKQGSGGYSLEIGSLAAVYRQKIEDNSKVPLRSRSGIRCRWLCVCKPSDSTDIASPKNSAPHEDTHRNRQLSAAKAVLGKATTNGFVSFEWENPSRNTEIEKPSKENESTKEPSLLQYLYVQSPAGLNGFNVLLSGSQSPHAVGLPVGPLPPLSVPCVVVPSPTLGAFPVLCSPTVPGPGSSAPSPLPNAGPVNFGLPGLGSTAHLLIGPAALVNPKSSTLPSTDPQLQGPCSLHLSPVMSRSHGSVPPGSPAYGGHPVPAVKSQQSPVPVTPKSIRCTHQETFFKTPGSLGDPVLRGKERNQSRSSSSAQRRLEIPSGGAD